MKTSLIIRYMKIRRYGLAVKVQTAAVIFFAVIAARYLKSTMPESVLFIK